MSLDAQVEERLATMDAKRLQDTKPIRKTFREARAEEVDQSFAKWAIPPEEWELTEDTLPAAITETHRRLVVEAMRANPGATAEEISEAVCLPVWNVKRLEAIS